MTLYVYCTILFSYLILTIRRISPNSQCQPWYSNSQDS